MGINDYSIKTDLHNSENVIHLHGEGSAGGTIFTEQRGHSYTYAGAITTETVQFKFGASSIYCNGGVLKFTDHADFDFQTDNFTIEGFLRSTTIAAGLGSIIGKMAATTSFAPFYLYRDTATIKFSASSNGSSFDMCNGVTVGTIAANTWYHFAIVRFGGNIICYLGGVQGSSTASSAVMKLNTTALCVGANEDASNPFNGYLDEIRITKGCARYTTAFTPPAAAFPDETSTKTLLVAPKKRIGVALQGPANTMNFVSGIFYASRKVGVALQGKQNTMNWVSGNFWNANRFKLAEIDPTTRVLTPVAPFVISERYVPVVSSELITETHSNIQAGLSQQQFWG